MGNSEAIGWTDCCGNKCYEDKGVLLIGAHSPLQFDARDLGFSFLGSGGGTDECGLV